MTREEFVEALIAACIEPDWDDDMCDLFEEKVLMSHGDAVRGWAKYYIESGEDFATAIRECVDAIKPVVVRSIEIHHAIGLRTAQKFIGYFAADK